MRTAKEANTAARIIGFLYITIIILSILSVIFIDSKISVKGNISEAVNHIKSNELLFRLGILNELIIYTAVLVEISLIYRILKRCNNTLASIGFYWRFAEFIFGGVLALSSILVVLILNQNTLSTSFTTDQINAAIEFLISVYWSIISIIIFFMSLGSITFFYLFYKSSYIPPALAIAGILAYTLSLLYSISDIVAPEFAGIIKKGVLAPLALFELSIGLWLLIKGINIKKWEGNET